MKTTNLNIPDKQRYTGPDFFISQSDPSEFYDFVVFTDSRGNRLDHQNDSNSSKLTFCNFIEKRLQDMGKSYLIISRCYELTTIVSLINFLNLNNIHGNTLITITGVVDFLPKKRYFIDLHCEQILEAFGDVKPELCNLGDYPLQEGIQPIFSYSLNKFIADNIANSLQEHFNQTYIIDTPEIPIKDANLFTRSRPDCFFSQLVRVNSFLNHIPRNSKCCEIIKVSHRLASFKSNLITSDALHFTTLGHQIIYEELLSGLT